MGHGWPAILAIKSLSGVAPMVDLRECALHLPPQFAMQIMQTPQSGFETQRRYHQKSYTGMPMTQNRTCIRV